eukprot:13120842-Ditylum_brightwellii.AAC.1
MVGTVQTSVVSAISSSVNLTVQMENIIKKSVADEIARILPGIIPTTLKELNVTKPITSNIDTSNSVTISTITGEGNITTMLKDNTVKEISNDNTNSTAISLQDSSSNNNSSGPAKENNNAKEEPQTELTQKKPSTLMKVTL